MAEFAVGLLLALNRKIPRAYNRTREGNFQLDGLMGFDLVGRTVGVIGTGQIGTIFARIMAGFGCTLIGFDSTALARIRKARRTLRRRRARSRPKRTLCRCIVPSRRRPITSSMPACSLGRSEGRC